MASPISLRTIKAYGPAMEQSFIWFYLEQNITLDRGNDHCAGIQILLE